MTRPFYARFSGRRTKRLHAHKRSVLAQADYDPSSERWAHTSLREGEWSGRDVILVGGGPSAVSKPPEWWAYLDEIAASGEAIVVATNHRCFRLPSAVAFTTDNGAPLTWHQEMGFGARPGDVPNEHRIFGVVPLHPLRNTLCWRGWTHLRMRPYTFSGSIQPWGTTLAEGIVNGGCTGNGALNFADILCAGSGRIYLIGYDYERGPTDIPSYAKACPRWRDLLEHWRSDVQTPVYVSGNSTLSDLWPRAELPL